MPADTDHFALIDQLSTAVAVLDDADVLVHANPALIEATGLTGWRGRPLASLGVTSDSLSGLAKRARREGIRLFLRGVDVRSSHAPLRCDIAMSPTADGVLLEMHALTPHDPASAPPRISQSLRGLAHEIKNPLAGLRGAAQLLQRRVAEPDLQHLATLIIEEADRLAALTDRLLRPGRTSELTAVNLHEVTERARALITAEANRALRLERDYDPSLPAFLGDADRMLQLTLNLLRNATQASARSITLRTRAEHNILIAGQSVRVALRMDVIDDGSGVPEHVRDTLFLPLVSGRDEGTGLGLTIAQEIAHEHGGQLTYYSGANRTVFSLFVPLERGDG